MSNAESSDPGGPFQGPSDRAGRIVEVLEGTYGIPDHPDLALTRLLVSLEDSDDAALLSALAELTANEDPHRG